MQEDFTPEIKARNESSSFGKSILEFLRFIVIVAVIVVPIRAFVAQPFIVSGHSMDTTFADGQYLVVDELTYHFNDPHRGDVIVFRPPQDPKKFYIKRVIGLPGEKVEVDNGITTITNEDNKDGFTLNEPYVEHQSRDPHRSWELGKDEYFVMGDNRRESSDSRSWGVLPEKNIIGRAYIRLLPLKEIGFLPGKYNFTP